MNPSYMIKREEECCRIILGCIRRKEILVIYRLEREHTIIFLSNNKYLYIKFEYKIIYKKKYRSFGSWEKIQIS